MRPFENRFPEDLSRFIRGNRPLADALRFLDHATAQVYNECFKHGADAERVADFLGGLDDAREILGEVLDELEAEENPKLQPQWDREAKQLWCGEILCREYRRVAPTQFEILDAFQEREWPESIRSPFRSEKQLRDTKDDLNGGLMPGSPIRFEVRNMRPAWFRFRPRSGSL